MIYLSVIKQLYCEFYYESNTELLRFDWQRQSGNYVNKSQFILTTPKVVYKHCDSSGSVQTLQLQF